MANTTNSIESILRGNMNRVNEMINSSNSKTYEFGLEDGKIQYTNKYTGKNGILAKSACAYVKIYLENAPIKGLEYSPVKGVTAKGNIFTKDAWTIKDKNLSLDEVLETFQQVVDMGRKLYKEVNKK